MAAAAVAGLGTLVLALLLEAPVLGSIAAAVVMGAIAAALAGIASRLTPRRAGGATFVIGAGIGVAILLAELLLAVIAVMFFSH